MPPRTRTRTRTRQSHPLKAIEPRGRPSRMATPDGDDGRRSLYGDEKVALGSLGVGLHSCPTELLSAVLLLAEHSSGDFVAAQKQRLSHSLVCSAWQRIVAANEHGKGGATMHVRGFKTARRLMRVYNADNARAKRTMRLSFDLERVERCGTNALVADVVSACDELTQLELRFLGRPKGSIDAACLTVAIYDAVMSRSELVELTLSFRRVWTSLTLGGDLTRALTKLTKLRRLSLPVIVVPRISPAFSFSPALTHLALHLTDSGSMQLLAHLLSTSRDSLEHLSLTLHTRPDLSTLPALLAPVSAQLRSFLLDSHDPLAEEMGVEREGWALPIPFSSILTPMLRLSTLTLADSLAPPLDVLRTLSRLRHLSYRLSSPASLDHLLTHFQEVPREGGSGITQLELRPSSAFRSLKRYYDELRNEDRHCDRALESRGILVVVLDTDGPTEEDEDDCED